jgi:hypothetical protein
MKQSSTRNIFASVVAVVTLGAFLNTQAATITVTSLADNGPGSLRQAIGTSASGDTIVFDPILSTKTITLNGGELTITNNLTITGLGAANLSLSGNTTNRIINITGSATVTITGLTLTGGNAGVDSGGALMVESGSTLNLTDCVLTANFATYGGAISSEGTVTVSGCTLTANTANTGGAIANTSTFTVTNSTLTGNVAELGGAIATSNGTFTVTGSTLTGNIATNGGAVANVGTINIISSTLSSNTASENGGALYNTNGTLVVNKGSVIAGNTANTGAGINNLGTLNITGGTIASNTANIAGAGIAAFGATTISNAIITANTAETGDGGGLYTSNNVVTVTQSTIEGNTALMGGGVYADEGGDLVISKSTLSNNTADSAGGVYNIGAKLMISRSTFAGNAASLVAGGAVYNDGNEARILLSTLTANTAADLGGAIANDGTLVVAENTLSGNGADNGGGAIANLGGNLTIDNTILAGSAGGNITNDATFVSKGHNLSDDDSSVLLNQPGDLNEADPGLDPAGLQDNGGPTKTILLVAGSAALGAGGPVFPPFSLAAGGGEPVYPPFEDQRGQPRFACGQMDIGAVQTQSSPVPNIALIGSATVTIECPDTFSDPGATATATCGDALNIAAGGTQTLALTTDGKVIAWGNDANGQTNVPGSVEQATAVSGGGYHSLALTDAGTVIAWGDNTSGQLNIPAGTENVIGISAGGYHSLAVKDDGSVVGWGDSTYGQTNVPVEVVGAVSVAAGKYHSLALLGDGTVVAWGAGITNAVPENGVDYGQANVPLGLSNVVAIAAGGYHSLALLGDGTVVAWGAGTTNLGAFVDFGQSEVPAGLSNVVAIAAGGYHSLAVQADGTVVGWGNNQFGQTTIPAGLTSAMAIAAGGAHSLAITADGTIYGWGMNTNGQATAPFGLNAELTGKIVVSTNGTPDEVGTAVFTYSVVDANGQSNSVTRTVVTVDTEPPVFTNCPTNIATDNDPGTCGARVFYTAPAGTDSCSTATAVQIAGLPSGSVFPVGTTVNVYRITDAGGNTTNCTFSVTVADAELPKISAANIIRSTAPGECQSAPVTYTPAVSDNCGVATNFCVPPSGSVFPKGTNTVTATVVDMAGNTNTTMFTVLVLDDEAPVITCPSDIVTDATGPQGAVVTFTTPTATDNCHGVGAVFVSPVSGSTFPIGVTTVSCSVKDAAGNTGTCAFTVTVRGPLDLLQDVRYTIIGWNNSTTNAPTEKKLSAVVKSLNTAVDSKYWPQPGFVWASNQTGAIVYSSVRNAIKKLQSQIKSKHNTIPTDLLQAQIDNLTVIMRAVTENSIYAADKAGASAKPLEKANDLLTQGDQQAAADDPAGAVKKYRSAWGKIAGTLANYPSSN